MKQQDVKQDSLKILFGLLPEKSLSADFRRSMMQQVRAEAEWKKKRKERMAFLSIILASLLMVALGVASLVILEVQDISLSLPESPSATSIQAILFMAFLSALLILGDYYMRKVYRKKHRS